MDRDRKFQRNGVISASWNRIFHPFPPPFKELSDRKIIIQNDPNRNKKLKKEVENDALLYNNCIVHVKKYYSWNEIFINVWINARRMFVKRGKIITIIGLDICPTNSWVDIIFWRYSSLKTKKGSGLFLKISRRNSRFLLYFLL